MHDMKMEDIMKLPLVSIILPCYNARNYIEKSLQSLMNQTYKNIEILVADDASTDETLSIIEKLK